MQNKLPDGDPPKGFLQGALEYLRLWRWTPTHHLRDVTILTFQTPQGAVLLRERQRLYFGRWGRWRWRRERRYVLTPETVH